MSNDILPNVISYRGDNETLVHRSEIEDFNAKSQLIVDESQEAIFFKNGQALDLFGPGRHALNSQNLPIMKRLFSALFGGKTPFPCHVYFINKVMARPIKWGTDKPIQVQDPKFLILCNARGYGQTFVSIADSRRFLVLINGQLEDFTVRGIDEYIRSIIVTKAKVEIAKAITEERISFVDISAKLDILQARVEERLNVELEDIGLKVNHFTVESINIPAEDFALLKQKREEFAAGMAEAELEAEKMRMLARARAEARSTEGYTYQEEQKFEVLKNAASNEGTAGGLMGAGMGLGMGAALGTGLGQSMGETSKAMEGSGPVKACPNCGAQVKGNAKFCPECGTKMPVTKFCPNCGTKLSEGAKFCPECGQKVGE